MSKATRQSACLISAVYAGFFYLHSKNFFSRVDIHELCAAGANMSLDMSIVWNKYGDKGDFEYAVEVIHDWSELLEARDSFFDAPTYVYITSRIVSDLSDKVKNKIKAKTLAEMKEVISVLEEFTDPEGKNFLAYEEGDRALDSLYKLIDWRW